MGDNGNAAAIEVPKLDELLPIKIFSERLGISIWTGRGYCYSGKVSSVKLGAKLLVPASEVSRLISENFRPRVA